MDANKNEKLKQILESLTSNDIVIDIGANTWYTAEDEMFITAAKKGVKIYAFEPHPSAFQTLKLTTDLYPSVSAINKAVSDKAGTMKLYLHEKSAENELLWSTGSSLLKYKSNVDKDKFVEVEVVDISEFLESLGQRVKILKIDVEGVEHLIINKLIDSKLIDQIDLVLAETHENKIPEIADEIAKLKARIAEERIENIDLNWI